MTFEPHRLELSVAELDATRRERFGDSYGAIAERFEEFALAPVRCVRCNVPLAKNDWDQWAHTEATDCPVPTVFVTEVVR